MKPKYEQTKEIDSWRCPWCGTRGNHTGDFDLHVGGDFSKCPSCGKESHIYFSIEYTSHPIDENGDEITDLL